MFGLKNRRTACGRNAFKYCEISLVLVLVLLVRRRNTPLRRLGNRLRAMRLRGRRALRKRKLALRLYPPEADDVLRRLGMYQTCAGVIKCWKLPPFEYRYLEFWKV